MQEMYYLETGSVDPRYNLALEETVLLRRRRGDYLLLWQNDNTVVVGRNQNTAEEIDADFVTRHGVTVVRRITGGGAVYHDLGNLNYSFITDAGDGGQRQLRRFTEPVVSALRAMGVAAEAGGRNDILVNGCKVSGTAQRLCGGRILHHGTLLFDADADMVAGALRPDPEKFRSKSAKSVRSRIGNIRDFLPRDMTLREFWDRLRAELARGGCRETALTDAELAEVRALQREKYDTWEWNYGRSPAYTMTHRRRFEGGSLEVRLTAEHGAIADVAFFGDFLALRDLEPLYAALRGCPLHRDALLRALTEFPLPEFLGGVTAGEAADTILGGEVPAP